MSKPFRSHNFVKSKQTEINSTSIHNEVYELHIQELNKKHNRNFKLKIDRETCNYNTKLGKAYQQADTDTLLFLDCEKTQTSVIKNISEKTRNKYYNDLYIEIISIFKWNSEKKKYETESPGWGLKNEELSPDCLSMLFLDKKNKTYHSIFIGQYKKLKTELFNEAFYNNLQNGKIEEWFNKVIESDLHKGRRSFIKSMAGQSKNNVKDVIFARNKGYITVGFTFPMSYIKSLVPVSEYNGQIVGENNKIMQY